VRDWTESCEWLLAVGTGCWAAGPLWPLLHYRIQGFPISPARHWPSHPVTSSPSSSPRNSSFRKPGLPCSAMAQTQHAHNGGVCPSGPPTQPPANLLSSNSYNESIFGQASALNLPASFSLEPPNLYPSPDPALFSSVLLAPNLSFFSLYHTFVCMTSTFVTPFRSK
jgi:hypothetical protein